MSMARVRGGIKRPRGPNPDVVPSRQAKKIHFEETAGGHLRDVTPSMAARRLYGCTSLKAHPRKAKPLREDKDDQPGDAAWTKGTSLRDTVLAGIQMGNAKQKAGDVILAKSIKSAVACPDDHRSILQGLDVHATTVADMQRVVMERLGIISNQSKQQDLNDMFETRGMSEMIHPYMTAFQVDEEEFHNFEHFVYREPHILRASNALQAVSGAQLTHQFWPQYDGPRDTGMVVNVAKDDSSAITRAPELRKTLEAACRENGYRKLQLDSCHFTHTDRGFTNKYFRYELQRDEDYEVNYTIDTESGSITMFEANVTSLSGIVRTWVWFEVTKPIASAYDGRLPVELVFAPQSWFIIAMPMRQVAKLKEN